MYKLIFKKNKSKYFEDALKFSKELNCEFDGTHVTIYIPDEDLMIAYNVMRTIFSYIQNWKDTRAYYNGKEVHPYQFILHAHRIGDCHEENIDNSCWLFDWGCKRINPISLAESGNGKYKSNGRYWYNYGYFKGERWVIDKEKLLNKILKYVQDKAIHICPFYDEKNVKYAVDNLPNYIIPDDHNYRIEFKEKFMSGEKIQVPDNIRHISKGSIVLS